MGNADRLERWKPAPLAGQIAARLWLAGALLAGLIVVALQVDAIYSQSLTDDEPSHLLAGHQALRYGQNTLNLEHPPLVKLLASLPAALATKPLAPRIDDVGTPGIWDNQWRYPEQMQRARISSRWVLFATIVMPLLLVCFFLGREVAGNRAGVILALLVGLSFDILPFLTLSQTDAGVTLGTVLTLVAAIRFQRRGGLRAALLVGTGLGIALASKFSGILVLPAVGLAAASPWPGRKRFFRRVALLGGSFLVAAAIVQGTYLAANWNYDQVLGRQTIRRYCENQSTLFVEQRLRPVEPALLAIERLDPGLAQWLTGLLGVRAQNSIGIYPNFAFGRLDSHGFWWYFPVLLLVKTPLPVLVVTLWAGYLWIARLRRRGAVRPDHVERRNAAVLLTFNVAVYMATAMASSYNIGIRHLLPVLPVLLLPAAAVAARRRLWSALLVGSLAIESILLTPLWMCSTNTWWLGRRNPTRFAFANANCDYRQNFLTLGARAARMGLEPLHVLYPRGPWGEIPACIPSAVAVKPETPITPGWYAVSVVFEQWLPAIFAAKPGDLSGYEAYVAGAKEWLPDYRAVTAGEDHGYIAGTFHLYYVPGRGERGAPSQPSLVPEKVPASGSGRRAPPT
jgi:Dolichyl-phosphate-mannose-protein mannosyltransferase